jgi:hypothetical protein
MLSQVAILGVFRTVEIIQAAAAALAAIGLQILAGLAVQDTAVQA